MQVSKTFDLGSNPSARAKFIELKSITMGKFGTYVQEAYDELLHKVTWLSWSNLQSKTWITLIGLLVLTLIIFGMDAISEAVMNLIYSFA